MTLQDQVFPIVFAQGLDTKDDDKQVIPGKLLELQNGIFTNTGKINKRFGYDILTTNSNSGGTLTVGNALSSFNNELLQFTGTQILSYSPNSAVWVGKGNAVSVVATNNQVIRSGSTQQLNPDGNVASGIEVYAWEDSRGDVRYSVVDNTTKSFLVTDRSLVVGASRPKVMTFASNFVIMYVVSGQIRYSLINYSNPFSVSSSVILTTSLNAAANYDAAVIGTKLYVAYYNVTNTVSVATLDSSFNIGSIPSAGNAGEGTNGVAIFGDSSNNNWVVAASTTAVKLWSYNAAGTIVILPNLLVETVSNVARVTGIVNGSVGNIFYEISATDGYNHLIRTNTVTSAATVGTATVFKRSVGLYSKPFSYGGDFYFTTSFESSLQPTYFTFNSSGNAVAKTNSDVGGGLRTINNVCEVGSPATGAFLFPELVKGNLEIQNGTTFTLLGVGSTKLDFASHNNFISSTLGSNLHIVGGIVQAYDGVSVVEDGFFLFPENITTALTSGSMGAGTYLYKVVYEWTDNFGNPQRSTTSVPISVTTGASAGVTLTIPTLRITGKTGSRSNVRICVYRTENGGADIYYQVTSVTSPLANDPTVDSVNFTDGISDAVLIGNTLLYTTGNVLDNSCPPACKLMVSYKNRIFLGGLEDTNLLWFSKNTVSGAPVEFSDALTSRCDARGGDITALGVLDDNLIIFKQNAIFQLNGAGPTDTGDQNDYGDPILVTSDVGCNNPNSVVYTPNGLMFQSTKGIYLLNRNSSVQYIGAPVQAFNSLTVTSATLIPNTNQVRFTTASVVLVYDYYYDQWSTFTGLEGVDADIWNGSYVILKSSGKVYLENTSSFTDGGSFIKLRLATSWLAMAGIQSFQRVKRCHVLGTYKGGHSLNCYFSYDYNTAYSDTSTIDAAAAIGNVSLYGTGTYGVGVYGGSWVPYQFRIHLSQQKCEAIKIAIEDSQTASFNEGFDISSLALQVGVKRGPFKLPAGNTSGN